MTATRPARPRARKLFATAAELLPGDILLPPDEPGVPVLNVLHDEPEAGSVTILTRYRAFYVARSTRFQISRRPA